MDGEPTTGGRTLKECGCNLEREERSKTVAGGGREVNALFSFILSLFLFFFFFLGKEALLISVGRSGKEPAGATEATADKE